MDWPALVEIARELPEVEESTWFATPSLKVRGKSFARLRAEDGLVVLRCDILEREALVQEQPEAFSYTDHYRDYPYVLIELGAADEDEVRELVIEAWRASAPKRLLRDYDRSDPS